MTTTQTLSITLPDHFDPLPSFTTESVRGHLTALCGVLKEMRSNPRNGHMNEEGVVLDLLIGRIDNAPSNADRDYLIGLLREATSAMQRRDSMNNDEAAYSAVADPALTATARQQLRMKQVRADRQMRLNWARQTRELLEENAQSIERETVEREASFRAIEGILDAGIAAIDNEVLIARAKNTGTVAVPDMIKLMDNIMSIATDGPTMRPRARMGF